MAERWSVLDEGRVVDGDAAAARVSTARDDGTTETSFASDRGRILVVVTNGSRAMIVLMDGAGDPGEHAASPGASGSSGGYVLENGQEDTYADADTVPLAEALDAVRAIVDTGSPPAGASWTLDR